MTTKAKTVEVTAPAIPADEAFGNAILSMRDAADAHQSRLQNERINAEAQFNREMERITAAWDAERTSLDRQIAQQGRILDAADAALSSLKGERSNVVAMAAE